MQGSHYFDWIADVNTQINKVNSSKNKQKDANTITIKIILFDIYLNTFENRFKE